MPDKARERYYFGLLRGRVADIPAGVAEEPEPPDFLVGTAEYRLGIELTSFHLPTATGQQSYQAREALKEHIVRRACELHKAAGGPALYVGVYFHDNRPLTKRDIQPLAQAIAESVLAAPMPPSCDQPVELERGRRPEVIAGIQIHPSIDSVDLLWQADSGGFVADITSAHIAEVIRAKARSIERARNRCDRLWLVIVHDVFLRGAPAEPTPAALAAVYDAAFDRVVWFDPHAPNGVIDLTLRRDAG